jgi:hypothetical protein|tara:strand:- start:357 stop:590 length:234 start_codon:yes stop_codon:yes gene_type:complete
MTMFKDSVNKKMFAIDREGQYLLDFGIAEKEIAKSLTDAAIGIKEGASDEKRMGVDYIEYLADCLKTGKLQVKWNIT